MSMKSPKGTGADEQKEPQLEKLRQTEDAIRKAPQTDELPDGALEGVDGGAAYRYNDLQLNNI